MTPSDGEWEALITSEICARPAPIIAQSFVRALQSASRPVLLRCDDQDEYVVKGAQTRRMATNDQIVGFLGNSLGAPVPPITQVFVPPELIAAQPDLQHMAPDVGHGSRFIADCADDRSVGHLDMPENSKRFLLLAVLYGWTQAGDLQFLYKIQDPFHVYSVDHGHFFPSGPDWNEASLLSASVVQLDPTIAGCCSFDESLYERAVGQLESIDVVTLASAVARPPENWGITLPERIALAAYLAKRQDELITLLKERIAGG